MITTPTRPTTAWAVDAARSDVEFDVKTFWGLANIHGRFDRFEGTYDGSAIELTIDAGSVNTGNTMRDTHLRSGGFFEIAEHPQIRFVSTHVQPIGERDLHVVGRLEAAGTSVPLEFPASIREQDGHYEIEATTAVDHRAFGMSSGALGMIRPPATLHVKAQLRRS